MTSAPQREPEPQVICYEPEEALRYAPPLPPDDELVIKDVTHEEWEAFRAALRKTVVLDTSASPTRTTMATAGSLRPHCGSVSPLVSHDGIFRKVPGLTLITALQD